MPEKTEKFQELVDRIHNGLDLISDTDLNMLFEEAEHAAPTPSSQVATPSTVSPSPAPVSAETTPPVVEVPKGQANILDLVPDKFKDKDEAESVKRVVKANSDLEAELTRKSQELAQLQSVVQTLSQRKETPPQEPSTQKKEEEDEIDDAVFFDKPTENTRKIAKKEITEAIQIALQHYDTFATRRDALNRFKDTHTDFDSFKAEVMEVCRIHPEWDQDVSSLPKIYDAAKNLAIEKAKKLSPTNSFNVEELTAKIKAEVEASALEKAKLVLLEEIKKRKSAAGILTSDSNTLSNRMAESSKTNPLTDEEKVFDEMMKSGPNSLNF